jgi:hypothetical protein
MNNLQHILVTRIKEWIKIKKIKIQIQVYYLNNHLKLVLIDPR